MLRSGEWGVQTSLGATDHNRHDTENKRWWVETYGPQFERLWCSWARHYFQIPAKLNPAKAADPYAPDIMVGDQLADLKVQQTPFMLAWREPYNLNPSFTVTLNEKDVIRYTERYPALHLYFHVDFCRIPRDQYPGVRVDETRAIYRMDMRLISQLVRDGCLKQLEYQRRTGDQQGNGRASYVLPLNSSMAECVTTFSQAQVEQLYAAAKAN